MKRTFSPALLAVLVILFVALELLYPSGPEVSGKPPGLDRRKFEVLRSSFSSQTVDYFLSVAFRREGDRSRIRKWAEPLRIRVLGSPTPDDLQSLDEALRDLRPLLAPLTMTLTEEGANVDVYYLPGEELGTHEPNFAAGSAGSYWCWWSNVGEIYRGRIVIATDVTIEAERPRLLRTYLMGVLGFMGPRPSVGYDSLLDPSQAAGGDRYPVLDRELVRLLYRSQIHPGMTRRSARSVLSGH